MMNYHSSQTPMVIHHHLFRASLLFVALLSTLSLPLLSLLLLFSNIMFMYKNRFAQPNKLLSENEATFERKSRDDKALHQPQVKSMDDNDSISCDIFEVDSCWSLESISEDVEEEEEEEEEEDYLIEIALVPEWRKNKHLERERESQVDDLVSEMSGEEENLIEIDISMGSITQPTANTLS